MTHIKITNGLDIPIKGKPKGVPQTLVASGEAHALKAPVRIALDLSPFEDVKFKLLTNVGDKVKLGQPLAEDKATAGRYFVSPAGGIIHEIRRGLKRRLLDIVIEVSDQEDIEKHSSLNVHTASRDELVQSLMKGGLFSRIRQRPFNFLADPQKIPRSIFIKAVDSAPFAPPVEMQLEGYEKEFQEGLNALTKLTDGLVHLVYRKETTEGAFLKAQNVQKHTVEGPHPVGNVSLHIQHIDPIRSPQDVIWVLDVHTVIAIGYFLLHGEYFVNRVISLAGPGILEEKTGFFKVREGFPVASLIAGRIAKGVVRLISGHPLNGRQVDSEDFLGYDDYVFCAIPENIKREFMHFFRFGLNKYTFSRTYLSGHLDNSKREYDFTTNQHGEERPFIDSTLYDKVNPLSIPVMHLVKAVLAEDYDLAVELGLLEVDGEDFDLPTFVDPSKTEMNQIIQKGLKRYAADILK
jgi:Na+-transporting NADH:ubiquinone oxidoreductase subunit A